MLLKIWGKKFFLLSQIDFSQEKPYGGWGVGVRLEKPDHPAQEKGFWITFSASTTLAGSGLNKPPAECVYG